jgi:hypothetical protein
VKGPDPVSQLFSLQTLIKPRLHSPHEIQLMSAFRERVPFARIDHQSGLHTLGLQFAIKRDRTVQGDDRFPLPMQGQQGRVARTQQLRPLRPRPLPAGPPPLIALMSLWGEAANGWAASLPSAGAIQMSS